MERQKGVESLIENVKKLVEDLAVRTIVEERIQEFLNVNKQDSKNWYAELVYCLLTAYSSAERGQLCVEALEDCGAMFDGSVDVVAETLRRMGHRFSERRAEYIVKARSLAPKLKGIVEGFQTSRAAREWLVKKVKGIGWKEASHFLRNVGYLDLAILDRHILSNMREHNLIPNDGSKGLTKRRYIEYERILRGAADLLEMPLGQMDLYLWYMKTGKILK
jgi:N-glycosylase/DNA lyase